MTLAAPLSSALPVLAWSLKRDLWDWAGPVSLSGPLGGQSAHDMHLPFLQWCTRAPGEAGWPSCLHAVPAVLKRAVRSVCGVLCTVGLVAPAGLCSGSGGLPSVQVALETRELWSCGGLISHGGGSRLLMKVSRRGWAWGDRYKQRRASCLVQVHPPVGLSQGGTQWLYN